jgi:hypothetical protein
VAPGLTQEQRLLLAELAAQMLTSNAMLAKAVAGLGLPALPAEPTDADGVQLAGGFHLVGPALVIETSHGPLAISGGNLDTISELAAQAVAARNQA